MSKERTVTLTFPVVGPLKISTLERNQVDPEWAYTTIVADTIALVPIINFVSLRSGVEDVYPERPIVRVKTARSRCGESLTQGSTFSSPLRAGKWRGSRDHNRIPCHGLRGK